VAEQPRKGQKVGLVNMDRAGGRAAGQPGEV